MLTMNHMAMLALAFICRNDTAAVEELKERLVTLNDSAKNLQAKADAENRQMTADEQREIEQIFASFEHTEAEIARREQIAAINAKVSAPGPRLSQPEPTPADARAAAAEGRPTGNRGPRVEAIEDRNKWGFRSFADYCQSVLKSSAKGANIDPRLIANATPSTYGSEGVGADGGFAVPPDFRTQIVQKIMGSESLLGRTDNQTSSSNSITFPADETTPWQSSGGILSSWESEGGLKGQSKPALTEKTVKLNKLISLVPVTDELLEDATSLANYINRKAPDKMNFKVDAAIIDGTGVGQPKGILRSAGTITVAAESGQTADTVVFANIVNMYNRLTPEARRNAVWLVNPDVEAQLQVMQFPGTGTAVPVYLPPGGLSAAPYASLFGRPVVPHQALPALGDEGDIVLGDLNSYLSVVKTGGVRSDVSIHLWFDYDMTAFRFVLRVGGQPWWDQEIAPFRAGALSRGFFVKLGARS